MSHPVKFADDKKLMRSDQGRGCHSEQAQQAGGEGQQETYEIQEGQMQRPTPRREEGLAVVKAVNGQAGEELCWEGRGVCVCPDGKSPQASSEPWQQTKPTSWAAWRAAEPGQCGKLLSPSHPQKTDLLRHVLYHI